VRVRFADDDRRGRIEAVEHALAVEEQQPVLRPPLRGEDEQLQLFGRQQLLVVEAESDLPVALGQVAGELEHPLRAHLHCTRSAC